MIDQVDEACRLKAMENRLCNLYTLVGCACKEEGEVYKLETISLVCACVKTLWSMVYRNLQIVAIDSCSHFGDLTPTYTTSGDEDTFSAVLDFVPLLYDLLSYLPFNRLALAASVALLVDAQSSSQQSSSLYFLT